MNATGGRRPQPQVVPLESGGVIVVIPDGYVPQFAGWFQYLDGALASQDAPGGVRQPRVHPSLHTVAVALADAARAQQAIRHRNAAFPDETPRIGSSGNLPATWDPQEEITVAQAADLTGYSPQYIRRLAKDHVIDGRQVDRDVWRLRTASVISIRDSRKGADDSDGQARDDGPRLQTRDGASGGCSAA